MNSYGEDRTSMFSRVTSREGSRAGAFSMNTLSNDVGELDGIMDLEGEIDGMLERDGELEGQGSMMWSNEEDEDMDGGGRNNKL